MSRNRSRSRLSASSIEILPSPLRSCSRMRRCADSAALPLLPKDELNRESRLDPLELLDRESRLELKLLPPKGEPDPKEELELDV